MLGIEYGSTNIMHKKTLQHAMGLLIEQTRQTLVKPNETHCETRNGPPPNRTTLAKPVVTPEVKPGVKPTTMVPSKG